MFQKENSLNLLQSIADPWYESLKDPAKSQERVLAELLVAYDRTEYGKNHDVCKVRSVSDLRANVPIIDYRRLNPYLAAIQKGEHSVLLPEPLACWVMTRGSTGPAKVLPATKTHLQQIFTCGARALVNHVLRKRDFELLTGHILNLNFPSTVHSVVQNGQTVTYGYSSGTYAKLNPMFDRISLLPKQEDIDELGPGITRKNWEQRFELAYQQARDMKITATMGVTPVILSFARYVKKKHGKRPKDLWNLRALFCTSVRKIQFKYAPVLRKLFGEVPVVEIYSATEGVFAQQLDDLPYVSPNYDQYFFEVETGQGVRMLHDLRRGEWGKLIISSAMFPRYDIGDLVEAAGSNYFRVIGRHNHWTVLEHKLYRLLFGAFL